ncbi:MAG TPA: YggS family pyridoxal phosphate-dependent enzyme, partial [Casimicrobiaceae bacterium]
MSHYEKAWQAVAERIDRAVRNAGRAAGSVRLLAVSKTFPADAVRAVHAAGQRAFGENHAQEGAAKRQALADLPDVEWHLIGPLQGNKTRLAAATFDWVESVDRLKIAQRLSAQRPAGLAPLDVCVQVNVSGEVSKSG